MDYFGIVKSIVDNLNSKLTDITNSSKEQISKLTDINLTLKDILSELKEINRNTEKKQ